jgi:hypothetical protein
MSFSVHGKYFLDFEVCELVETGCGDCSAVMTVQSIGRMEETVFGPLELKVQNN